MESSRKRARLSDHNVDDGPKTAVNNANKQACREEGPRPSHHNAGFARLNKMNKKALIEECKTLEEDNKMLMHKLYRQGVTDEDIENDKRSKEILTQMQKFVELHLTILELVEEKNVEGNQEEEEDDDEEEYGEDIQSSLTYLMMFRLLLDDIMYDQALFSNAKKSKTTAVRLTAGPGSSHVDLDSIHQLQQVNKSKRFLDDVKKLLSDTTDDKDVEAEIMAEKNNEVKGMFKSLLAEITVALNNFTYVI